MRNKGVFLNSIEHLQKQKKKKPYSRNTHMIKKLNSFPPKRSGTSQDVMAAKNSARIFYSMQYNKKGNKNHIHNITPQKGEALFKPNKICIRSIWGNYKV